MDAWNRSEDMNNIKFSVCTTNYNCAHALRKHLDSVYSLFDDGDFEYIVVDNKSKDNSMEILKEYKKDHKNMLVLSQKCTMGRGRQIAFGHSKGRHIVVVDTDTIYYSKCKDFIEICLEQYPNFAVQAIFCGVFPREIWERIGGRRDMNFKEDFDMWMRIWEMDKMKWYPVSMGENIKEGTASAGMDYLSSRYGKFEKFSRLIRREIDLFKTRRINKYDFSSAYRNNIIDLGLGEEERWFGEYPDIPWPVKVTRDIIRILKS